MGADEEQSAEEIEAEPADLGAERPRRRWVTRVGSIILGLAVGLLVAEYAFSARDDGAFPHLNCYIASDTLGVALEPGTTTRIAFQENPATDVSINSEGFRGPEWGEAGEDEILVVGDSQAFGLGVADDETLAASLAELTGRPAINGGVPTYGPLEYSAVARRLLEARQPSTVVYVINMANDFFEHSRPNTERHGVWDGWAVRAETTPHDVTEFPGRAWLYGRSHAFYALRRFAHEHDSEVRLFRETGFESEGTLRDLLHESEVAEAAHTAMAEAHVEEVAGHHARLVALEGALETAEDQIDDRLGDQTETTYPGPSADSDRGLQMLSARSHPGDIVGIGEEGESARNILVTATMLNRGVRLRARLVEAAREGEPAVAQLVEERAHLRDELEAERAHHLDRASTPSVLEPRILEMAELAAEHGAELIVVALPLDVLVSDEEFAKYDAEPVDMTSANLLLRDLVDTTERLGVRAIDPTEALRAIEPGAFLDGDLHLSASGQRAVAEAVRDRLAEPAPLRHPAPGLPEGRSAIPEPDEYLHAVEINARGSTAAGCATDLVREWLRISCRSHPRGRPTGVELVEGGHGEALTVTTTTAATILAPLMAGDNLVADFHWEDRTQRLTVHWPASDPTPTLEFSEHQEPVHAEASEDPATDRLCACHREVHEWTDCRREYDDAYFETHGYDDIPECGRSCEELYGAASLECMRAYPGDCEGLLRCARGETEHLPICDDGRVNALGTGRCLALCDPEDEARGCTEGSCVPWQGTNVCATAGAHGSSGRVFEAGESSRDGDASASPTVATFGGERCEVRDGSRSRGRQSVAACATESGAVVASYRGDRVWLERVDADGALVGEPIQTALPESSPRYGQRAYVRMACGSPRDVLAYSYPCRGGYCVSALILADGAVVGDPIGPISVGPGVNAEIALEASGDDVWIAWGSVRGPIQVERWTLDAAGGVERHEVATLGPGLPRDLAVDTEHWALLYGNTGRHERLVVDGGEPSELGQESPCRVALAGERADVLCVAPHGTVHAISEPPRGETLLMAPTTTPAEARLPLETSIALMLRTRPSRGVDETGGVELMRLHQDTHAPLARPIELPTSMLADASIVWVGDRALVFRGTHVYVVRCE